MGNPVEIKNINGIIEQISEIVARHLDTPFKLILFGSRASSDYDPRSDIDIGIISDSQIKSGVMIGIRDELDDIPTLLKIDLVDFNRVSDEFRNVAMQNVQEIIR